MAYAKPTQAYWNLDTGGFGQQWSIIVTRPSSAYPYAYVCNTSNGYYYYRKSLTSTSTTVQMDSQTNTSYITYNVILSDTDLGAGPITVGNEYSSYIISFSVHKYCCFVWCQGASAYVYGSTNTSLSITNFGLSYDGTLSGFSTSRTSLTPTYTTLNPSTNGSQWNTYILYAIGTSSTTIKYYRGTSTAYSASGNQTWYGQNSISGYTCTEPTTTCLANSSYTFQGWARSSTSTTVYYDMLLDALNAGYTTVYGVYYKSSSSSNSTVYYYRGTSTRNSVTETATTAAAYYYGTGSHTGGGVSYSYGTITTTCAADSSYTCQGWTGSSTSTTATYSTPQAAFASYNTIYGIYYKAASSSDATCYYYRGSSTRNSVTKTTSTTAGYYYGTGTHTGGVTSTSLGTMTTTCASDSSYTLQGWTGSSTSTTVTYSTADSAFGSYSTIYGIYKKAASTANSTVYYYRGGPTQNSTTKSITTADAYYYGAGSHTGGGQTTFYDGVITDCEVAGWDFIGFSPDASTTSATNEAEALYNAGYTTIYGTYSRLDEMTYYPQLEDVPNDGLPSIAENYRYGINSVTNNIPPEPTLTNGDIEFLGWAATSESDSPDTWNNLWNSGITTVYAIWADDQGNVYVNHNGTWIKAKVYVYNNGWQPSKVKVNSNGQWV